MAVLHITQSFKICQQLRPEFISSSGQNMFGPKSAYNMYGPISGWNAGAALCLSVFNSKSAADKVSYPVRTK
jgi:hypothetical protein